jgi:YD repeat-containing protein
MKTWLPPQGMTGSVLAFYFREGGGYRMRLVYDDAGHLAGKTSDDADEVEVRFTKLVADERIEQAVTFDSEDPAFSGEMKITWTLEPMGDGTLVTVQCENVPDGIRAEDHEAALSSTLENLAAFASGDT